ncbi:unnamed protein product [Linum trigynum]
MVTLNKAKRVQSMRKRKAAHSVFLQNLAMNSLMIVGCALLLYTPTKQFLFLHLPNVLSCLSSPKCVFVLVNVIVVYLVGESRLNGHEGSSRRSSLISDVYYEYVGRARAQRELVTSPSIPTQEKSTEVACEVERQIVAVDKVVSLDDEVVAGQTERGIVVVDDETTLFEDEAVESESASESVIVVDEITTSFEDDIVEQEEQRVINENENNEEKVEEQVEDKIEVIEEKGGRGAGDELNRRIEDFIARVNRQRQLEIQSLVSCKA